MDFLQAANSFAQSLSIALEDKVIQTATIEDGEGQLKFSHNGCTITVTVGDFWAQPGKICYFVNVSHPNGNFMAQSGTANEITAAINVGKAIHFANTSGDPLQSEDF